MTEYNKIDELTEITTTHTKCQHVGYYHYIDFLFFRQKILVCEKCGKLIKYGWRIK